MIGRLRGTLVSKQPPWLLVEVGGVGYELEAPMSTIYDLPQTGKEVTLLTHYAVKEDSVALYGFLHESERASFRNLLKVSGIGAKTALAVLSGVSTQDFARLVQAGDVVALTKIPGIGKKTAERIVVELRDRVDGLGASMPGLNAGWFKLRNGEKAFCVVTEQSRVSYLRSASDNVSLLLSLENPDRLKALLER